MSVIIRNVPATWADDQPVTEIDQLRIALLRGGGCTCELPLLRNARDAAGELNDGPRCKTCNVQVLLIPPTEEEKLAYMRRSHQAAVRFLARHPGAFGGWKSECFDGCGCAEAEDR